MAIISLISTVLVLSCSKDSDEEETSKTVKQLVGKWVVDAPASFKTIEFTETGIYIIVGQTANEIVVGTFSVDGKRITLANYAEIEGVSVSGNAATFKIALDVAPQEFVEYKAVKAASPITDTERSRLVSASTWKVISVEYVLEDYNGDGIVNNEDYDAEGFADIQEQATGSSVLFTKAGTYLILFPIGSEQLYQLGSWKWKDANEEVISYTQTPDDDAEWRNGSIYTLSESELIYRQAAFLFYLKH